MRATTLVVICLAGCSSPKGVAIEVHPGATPAETVELFIGRTACKDPDCGGIQPPGVDGKLSGTVTYRDGDPIDSAPMVDGVVTFKLVPDGGDEKLPLVIAVGFDNGEPDSVAIIHDLEISSEPQLVYATLSGASNHIKSLPTSAVVPDGDRVNVWRELAAPMSSCVVVQRWRNNQPEHLFVVPTDDPDCDDVPNGPLECNQDVFHASTAPRDLAQDSCIASFKKDGVEVCRIGGVGCTDGVGMTPCAPSPFCLPDIVCASVDGCKTPDPACIGNRTMNLTNIPRITCVLPTESGQPCAGNDTASIDLGQVFGPEMATCTALGFDTALSGSLMFAPTLHFANGVEIIPTGPQPPCAFDISWLNPGTTNPMLDDRALIQITVDNGEHIIVPFIVHYLPGQCGGVPITCSVDYGVSATGMDSVWTCVD